MFTVLALTAVKLSLISLKQFRNSRNWALVTLRLVRHKEIESATEKFEFKECGKYFFEEDDEAYHQGSVWFLSYRCCSWFSAATARWFSTEHNLHRHLSSPYKLCPWWLAPPVCPTSIIYWVYHTKNVPNQNIYVISSSTSSWLSSPPGDQYILPKLASPINSFTKFNQNQLPSPNRLKVHFILNVNHRNGKKSCYESSNKDDPTCSSHNDDIGEIYHKDDNDQFDHEDHEVSQTTPAPAENAPVLMDYYVPPYPHAGHDMVAFTVTITITITITIITTTTTSNVSSSASASLIQLNRYWPVDFSTSVDFTSSHLSGVAKDSGWRLLWCNDRGALWAMQLKYQNA